MLTTFIKRLFNYKKEEKESLNSLKERKAHRKKVKLKLKSISCSEINWYTN